MKKRICLLLVLCICMSTLFGCGKNQTKSENGKKFSVVCTIFPEYDWVKEVLGDQLKDTDLTLLLDEGMDLHSYQPTTADIAKISACDLFIYVGGESDGWVKDALGSAVNKNMKVINLLEVLKDTIKEEEVVEGMQGEEEEEGEEGEEEPEYDEHVWLSLRNAKTLVESINTSLCDLDSTHADQYKKNTESYTKQLDDLDASYQEMVNQAKYKTVLFGDRFPFRYLVDDYNITYYAAFVGCSAETEASFETIVFLAKKMDELTLPAVLTIDGSDGSIAKTIIENTREKNQETLQINSMQSVKHQEIEEGLNYLSIMKDNLDVLKKALND